MNETNKQQIAEAELIVELAKETQKYNRRNPFKNKIISKVRQLLMVLRQGETIEEKEEKGKPNWKEVYHFYIGGEAPADRI